MKRKILNVALIVVLTLSLTTAALGQSDDFGSPDASNRALGNKGEVKSYIVVMDQLPIATYEGNVAGYPATKPGKDAKVNPNSAHVRKYEKFLESQHDASLAAAGVDASAKVNDYAFALNGYSALLTDAEVTALKAQKDIALVLEDQMRYATTDSSPTFLGLTAPGGAYAQGLYR